MTFLDLCLYNEKRLCHHFGVECDPNDPAQRTNALIKLVEKGAEKSGLSVEEFIGSSYRHMASFKSSYNKKYNKNC